MRNYVFKSSSIVALLVLLCMSCAKDEMPANLDEVISRGGGFDPPEVNMSTTDSMSFLDESEDGTTWQCVTETVSIQDGAGGNGGYPLFSPNASVIYPGNLLQGNSLNDATPKEITVDRAGGVISTDIVDGNLQSQYEIPSITKGNVTEAINGIIAGSTSIVPANFSVNIKNIQSREQFALALGLEVNSTFFDMEGKLNYSSDVERSSFLVSLTQSFYTMSYDKPTSLDQIFAPTVTVDQLEKFVGPGNPATYISDVTYGRIYFMMVSSTSSKTEMSTALNASYRGLEVQVDGSIEVDHMKDLKELSISVFAYGGASAPTLETVGVTDLQRLNGLLAQASDVRAGKALSYVVRSVFDNQIVSTQLATTYDVTNCTPTGAFAPPPYTEHWTGEIIPKFGPVGAAFCPSGTEFYLINKEGDQFLKSTTGNIEGPFSIHELGNQDCPYDKIGAICNINGNESGFNPTIQFFNETGTNYRYLDWNSGNYVQGPNHPVSDLADGENPMSLSGVGAVSFFNKDDGGPSRRVMFGRSDNSYSFYSNSDPNEFGTLHDLFEWGTPDGIVSGKIVNVGAAVGFNLGNFVYTMMFNKAGTKYVIYNHDDASVVGPFFL